MSLRAATLVIGAPTKDYSMLIFHDRNPEPGMRSFCYGNTINKAAMTPLYAMTRSLNQLSISLD